MVPFANSYRGCRKNGCWHNGCLNSGVLLMWTGRRAAEHFDNGNKNERH